MTVVSEKNDRPELRKLFHFHIESLDDLALFRIAFGIYMNLLKSFLPGPFRPCELSIGLAWHQPWLPW